MRNLKYLAVGISNSAELNRASVSQQIVLIFGYASEISTR